MGRGPPRRTRARRTAARTAASASWCTRAAPSAPAAAGRSAPPTRGPGSLRRARRGRPPSLGPAARGRAVRAARGVDAQLHMPARWLVLTRSRGGSAVRMASMTCSTCSACWRAAMHRCRSSCAPGAAASPSWPSAIASSGNTLAGGARGGTLRQDQRLDEVDVRACPPLKNRGRKSST